MADCVFCKIRDGQIPSVKVYEDDKTFCIMDINPLNRGHCLVITKVHAATLFESKTGDLEAAIALSLVLLFISLAVLIALRDRWFPTA